MWQRTGIFVLAAMLAWPLGSSWGEAAGAPSASPQAPAGQLEQIQRELTVKRRELVRTQQEERRVLGELSGAEERLQRAQAGLRKTAVALTGTRRAVVQATSALADVSKRLAAHEAMMAERLRALYMEGPLGYLSVLLGATDFRDFVTRTYLVGLIVSQDLSLYQQVVRDRQRQHEVRQTLTAQEARLTVQERRLTVSRQETARLADERRRLLDRVRNQRASQEAAVRELEAESRRITEIIRRSQGGRPGGPILSLRNGALAWPVSGPITSGYGWRIHPIFGSQEFHTGIDIAARWGTPVGAAADGTVLYTGWMRGYGLLVILDHGGGVSTIYSHLSSAAVRAGDHVHRGQTIARIGSTGWSTGPHLFFEVRQNGQPLNPLGP